MVLGLSGAGVMLWSTATKFNWNAVKPTWLLISEASLPLETTLEATGNSLLGRGARGGIPLVLRAQSGPVALKTGDAIRWTVRVRALGDATR